jgi:tripartite-type tricarboxylate transporter receptor subunit TctC
MRAALAFLALVPFAGAKAQSPADFYKGKTVTMIVGTTPGATYDIWARLVARHLPRYIPGAPNVIVQNMPGAGSTLATNYIYNAAPQDGTVMGLMNSTNPFEPLLGVEQTKFDARKINWLGSPGQDTAVVMIWHTSPVNSLEDAKKKEVRFAATSLNGTAAFYVRIFNSVFGTKFKLVFGYPGLSEAMLAMERGEVEGHPSPYWSYLKNAKPDWIQNKSVKFILQYGASRNPELPDVPFAHDLVTNADDRALLDAAVAPLTMGYPFFMGPGAPRDRVTAIRTAFAETFADPAFLKDAAGQNLEIEPISGEAAEKSLLETYDMPAPVLERLKRLYRGEEK